MSPQHAMDVAMPGCRQATSLLTDAWMKNLLVHAQIACVCVSVCLCVSLFVRVCLTEKHI